MGRGKERKYVGNVNGAKGDNLFTLEEIKSLKKHIQTMEAKLGTLESALEEKTNKITRILGNNFHAYGENAEDCNDLYAPGFYAKAISKDTPNGPGFWGYLLVLSYGADSTAIGVRNLTQVVFGYNVQKIAIRFRYGGTWRDWKVFE